MANTVLIQGQGKFESGFQEVIYLCTNQRRCSDFPGPRDSSNVQSQSNQIKKCSTKGCFPVMPFFDIRIRTVLRTYVRVLNTRQ